MKIQVIMKIQIILSIHSLRKFVKGCQGLLPKICQVRLPDLPVLWGQAARLSLTNTYAGKLINPILFQFDTNP